MSENKKPTNALQAVLDQQAGKNRPDISQPTPLQTKEQSKTNTTVIKEDMPAYTRPSRTGKRLIGGHFSPENSLAGKTVFNRTVTLRDAWQK